MKVFPLVLLLFLTACSTTRPPALALRPQVPPTVSDNSATRYPEVIRAYHIGRYVDPNDDLVMHEQHVLYRVEENPRWDLRPATTHPGPAGGSIAQPPPMRDAAFSPTPVNDAILAEVNAQRLATAQIMLEAKTLAGALARFQAALQQTKTNLQETAILRVEVNAMQKQLDDLEAAQKQNASSATLSLTNPPPDQFDSEPETTNKSFDLNSMNPSGFSP
jgi:hypothetical protein